MFSPLLQFNMLNSFQWCHKLTCQATQTNRAKHHSQCFIIRGSISTLNKSQIHCCQRCWRFSATQVTSCSIHASGAEVEVTAHLSCAVLLFFQSLFVGSMGFVSYSLFLFLLYVYVPACIRDVHLWMI